MIGRPTRSRSSRHRPALAVVSLLLLAACQASASSSGVPASVAVATQRPTPEPLPTSIPRQNDIPADGICEDGHACLGLLKPGAYHTQLFVPGFSFTMPEPGWENIAMTPGAVPLFKLDAPGDQIAFFTQPKLTKTDGTLDLSASLTVDGITGWLAKHPDLTVGPATDVTVGGLQGKRMTVEVAPTSTAHYPPDCPVETCVNLMQSRAPTWAWDWGTGSSEKQRLDILAAKDGVVLIFLDSPDGKTYDGLVEKADAILATVKFDK